VQLDDVPASGSLMQTVHVLRNEMEPQKEALHFHQGEVRWVWFRTGDKLPPPLIPLPNEAGIALEGARSGQFFGTVFCPQAGLGIAKRGDAAFRGYASPCEHGHAFGSGKALDQFSRNRHGWIVASFEKTNNHD